MLRSIAFFSWARGRGHSSRGQSYGAKYYMSLSPVSPARLWGKCSGGVIGLWGGGTALQRARAASGAVWVLQGVLAGWTLFRVARVFDECAVNFRGWVAEWVDGSAAV